MSEVVRIIARRVIKDQSGGLRWDALTESGELLFANTEYPFFDGAYALLKCGMDPEDLVNMRHEGAVHDSFEPVALRVPATVGGKRAKKRGEASREPVGGVQGSAGANPSAALDRRTGTGAGAVESSSPDQKAAQ